MLVLCEANNGKALPASYLSEADGYFSETRFPLTVGKTYVVMGLTSFLGGIWYYLADDNELDHPVWYPSPLFRIVDGRISSLWRASEHGQGWNYEVFLAFPEWAADWSYYDRLTDGEREAVAVYRRYRAMLEAEHSLGAGPSSSN